MRWIVLSLLVANIAAFVYMQFFTPEENVGGEEISARVPIINDSVRSVQLLREFKPSRVNIQSIAVVPKATPIKKEVGDLLCTLVGPFPKLLRAEYFVEQLQSLGVTSEIRSIVVSSEPGFWLHLSPEKSRRDALRRLSELQARGIDSYVIPDGNLANGISLGMFSNKKRAQAMERRIKEQGYQPQLINVPREQKELWVFLSRVESSKIGDEKWLKLISAKDLLQKRQNVCADVASL